ncbi:MAG: hypothetical protein ACO25B_11795 [Chitinophagaceae bacterium]
MQATYGTIQIIRIDNCFPNKEGEKESRFLPLPADSVKFVHYPDCQQLIIWLPRPGSEYGVLRLMDTGSGHIIEEWPLSEKLNGSIQVLWDTLTIPPGTYRIEIEYSTGGLHLIELEKYEAGAPLTSPVPADVEEEKNEEPLVYRDGLGRVIENEDLTLREKLLREIKNRFTRHIEYSGSGRAGTVTYVEGETRIDFYYEIGGGDCVACIDIPQQDRWEAATQTPLNRREDIIEFTARSVQQRQAPNCRIEISEQSILFFRK